MHKKKVAVIIYPEFSSYEISILLAILKIFEKKIVVFSAEKNTINSEEGLHFAPDKTFNEFNVQEYDCLVLPGMWSFPKVLNDDRYISFLSDFKYNNDIIIASISSSPILLAKSGLLDGKQFCAGLFEDDFNKYNFLNKELLLRQPIVIDGNIITAVGLAYREFGITVARKLNLECNENWFSGIKKTINENDYIFYRNN
jgi:protein deglycase